MLRWVLVGAIVLFLLNSVSISHSPPPSLAPLLTILGHMETIHTAAMAIALDDSTTGAGTGGYPADVGAKTNLEYIAYLVQRGGIKESQLDLFCKEGVHPKSLKELRAENLAIKFANVSVNDPRETIFAVTRNYAEQPTAPPQENVSPVVDYKNGIAMITLGGGSGISRSQAIREGPTGVLPPREPKFLGD
ncbi:MAG: hypothetical protein B9S32_02430 [Verrucomicrobia bacterium Tous-C9LFEB]|nr:MAG: hypothetical protein B9S32_02430 [Verrucomicrobia bacterium Tous-C9LFEB]